MARIIHTYGESKYIRQMRYRQFAERAQRAGEPFPLPIRSGVSVLQGGPIPGYEKYKCGGKHVTMKWSQADIVDGKPHCPYCHQKVLDLMPPEKVDQSDAQIRQIAAGTQAANAAVNAKRRRTRTSRIWFGPRAED